LESNLLEWLTMFGEWGIVIIIGIEGWIALKQHRSSKIFDTVKYVEDPETREARKRIYENLRRQKHSLERWWERDEKLRDAAAIVCVRYNLVGAVTKNDRKVREFVAREWAHNICETYEALQNYIRYRENPETGIPGAFHQYQWLYIEAKTYRSSKK